MSLTSMWIHGNATVVEAPESLDYIVYYGWGANFGVLPKKQTWLHIPIPTPAVSNDTHLELQTVYLLFQTTDLAGTVDDSRGRIEDVHIYDGPVQIQPFDGIGLRGDLSSPIKTRNIFSLDQPHRVSFGISLSFLFLAAANSDTNNLLVLGAGADFITPRLSFSFRQGTVKVPRP